MTPVEVTMTVEEAARAVLTAHDPADLFGALAHRDQADVEQLGQEPAHPTF
jgi:hypothetical protein